MDKINYSAAWVPDNDPECDWDDAAEAVARWVLDEAKWLGTEPLLVTPTQFQWIAGSEVISWFARTYPATTPRSDRLRGGGGAVLAYVPDYETMHLAAGYARDYSLGVVESVASPLIGWAMEARALVPVLNLDGH